MDRVALDLGIIQIYWYSIFIFLAMLVACFVIYNEAKKRNVDEDFLVNLTFNSVIFGIVGARLYYVLFNLPYYLSNPIEILQIWNGGLAIHGGILTALIFIIIYCKKHRIKTIHMLDIIVVGLILGQAIGRWGNFFNSEAYGGITTLENLQKLGIPEFICNGMYIMGEYRQPTFLYESIWCLFGFLAMIIIRRYKSLKIGQLTGFYLVWYGIIRFIIEIMRSDSLMLGPLKIAQLVSIGFIIVGVVILIRNKNKPSSNEEYLYRSNPKEKIIEPGVYFN